MPTSEHELPLEMVRNRPQLVPTILRTVFDLDMPDDGLVSLTSESYADLHPAELRCDATVLLDDPETPTHGIVVEHNSASSRARSSAGPPTSPCSGTAANAT